MEESKLNCQRMIKKPKYVKADTQTLLKYTDTTN